MKKELYTVVLSCLPLNVIAIDELATNWALTGASDLHQIATKTLYSDSINLNKGKTLSDTITFGNQEFKLNEDAVKMINFDFSPKHQESQQHQISPIDKPWMDFQVDLSIPKSMIDTTKIRKPQKYIRMLPYTFWVRFGEDPVYDVSFFGNKKRFEITWELNIDDFGEFGWNVIPKAGSYNPNSYGGSSVVIGDLDFIRFLYSNFNKQGRIRKHNRKYANAWKTYNSAPFHIESGMIGSDSLSHSAGGETYSKIDFQRYKSIELIEEKQPKYFERPDYRLLQTPEQRYRFGTFYDSELYALPSDTTNNGTDSSYVDSSENRQVRDAESRAQTNEPTDNPTNNPDRKLKRKKSSRLSRKEAARLKYERNRWKKQMQKEKEEVIKELPNSMDDLYKYIRTRKLQDSIQRVKQSRKDKVTEENVYQLEQQLRKLEERQN